MFAGFFHQRVAFPPISILHYLEASHWAHPVLRQGEDGIKSHVLESGVSACIVWNSSVKVLLFPPLFDLVIYLCQYGLSHFVAKIMPGLTLPPLLLCSSDMLLSFWFWSPSLLSDTARCSRLMYFPCSSPRNSHSPKNLGSFYWEMVFRNQDLDSGSAHCYWSVIVSRPSHVTELGNMYTYILTDVSSLCE